MPLYSSKVLALMILFPLMYILTRDGVFMKIRFDGGMGIGIQVSSCFFRSHQSKQ